MLFAAVLTRVDTSDDSATDQDYLGYLLILFVIPGYVNMAWQCVKAYLDVLYDALDEAEKAKDEANALDTSWCGSVFRCLGRKRKPSGSAASKSAAPRQLELAPTTGLAPLGVQPLREGPRVREPVKIPSTGLNQTSFNPIHEQGQTGEVSIKTDTFNPDGPTADVI